MPPRVASTGRTQQGRTPKPAPASPGGFRPASGPPPQRQAPTTGGKTQQGTQGGRSVRPARPARQPKQPKRPGFLDRSRQAQRAGREFTAPEFHNYQGIILAEFVLAELLVAATPIASSQNQPGLSPYVPRDMSKLLAIGLLYFFLELMAVGGRGPGRFGAWFGGLILLTVGLNESANIAKDLNIFGGGPKKTQAGPPPQAT